MILNNLILLQNNFISIKDFQKNVIKLIYYYFISKQSIFNIFFFYVIIYDYSIKGYLLISFFLKVKF